MRWRNLFCRSRNNSLDVLLRRAPEMRYLRGYQSKADEDWQTAYSPTIEVFAIPHKPKPFAKIVEQTLGQYRLEIWEPVRLSAHAVAKAWRICVRNVQDETCHFFGIIALYCGLAQRAKDSVAHSIVIRDARLSHIRALSHVRSECARFHERYVYPEVPYFIAQGLV